MKGVLEYVDRSTLDQIKEGLSLDDDGLRRLRDDYANSTDPFKQRLAYIFAAKLQGRVRLTATGIEIGVPTDEDQRKGE